MTSATFVLHATATAMTFEPVAHLLAFVLPLSFQKGDVTFYPTKQGPDLRVAITPDAKSRHVISTAELAKGIWVARINWSDGRQQYFQEQELIVTYIINRNYLILAVADQRVHKNL